MNDNEKMITNLPGFKKAREEKEIGAFRALFKFDNSFGASIVRSNVSYGGDKGLFELAVIYWYDENDWKITYTTPITDDVLGYLTVDDVKETLTTIQALTKDNCYYDWDEDEEVLDNEL